MASQQQFQRMYALLNIRQREAVDAIEGPVMVLAGPGTGKTQVLAMRVANILKRTQMDPWNILCLTFTDSATVEMRERLREIIGQASYAVRVCTFHSFCNDVMREFPEKFSVSPHWDVLSDAERIEIFQSVVRSLPGTSPLKPFGNPTVYVPDLISTIRSLKQEDISPERYRKTVEAIEHFLARITSLVEQWFAAPADHRGEEESLHLRARLLEAHRAAGLSPAHWAPVERIFAAYEDRLGVSHTEREVRSAATKLKREVQRWVLQQTNQLPKQQELADVYKAYQRELVSRGRYDFEDMIMMVVQKFRDDEELLAHYREQFQYILVDEYQDTNGAQNETVELLGSDDPTPNIFVVGDDKQSIFRFQGASLENLLHFYRLYKEHVNVISLEDNYRSHQGILDAAQSLIAHNAELVTKYIPSVSTTLRAARATEPSPIERYEFDSEDAEDYFIAKKIQQLIDEGVDPGHIAVLYRYHRDGVGVRQMLLRFGIPIHVGGGENVLTDRLMSQLVCLLTYLADDQNDALLAEIIAYEFWGLSPVDVLKVIHAAGRAGRGLFQVISSLPALEAAECEHPEQFLAVAKKLAQWRAARVNHTVEYLLDVVVRESGFLQFLLGSPASASSLQKLSVLFSEIKRLNNLNHSLTLSDVGHHLDLLAQYDMGLYTQVWQADHHAVCLLTAHRAKGMEFEHVFIIRACDRHWGNVRTQRRIALPHGLVRYDPYLAGENNEDERRLFYVALTRAKQQVYLTYARYNLNGSVQTPSLFVEEIPEHYVQSIEMDELGAEQEERLRQVYTAALPAGPTQNVQAWVSRLLEHYTMSVTHLNNYLECPRLFYYRNLLRVPAVKTKHMAFGTAVHRALRDIFGQYVQRGRLPAKKLFLERFEYWLEGEVLKESEYADSLSVGRQVLSRYFDAHRTEWKPNVLLEYNFRSHGVHLDDLPLTGQLDKVEVLDEKRKIANVVDYKTGNPDAAAKRLKPDGDYRRQLLFYKLLCDLSPRFEYEMVQGTIDFVQPSKRTGKFVQKNFVIASSDTEDLKATIKRVWQEIQELRFLEPEVGCGNCEYCKAAGIPAGRSTVKTHPTTLKLRGARKAKKKRAPSERVTQRT